MISKHYRRRCAVILLLAVAPFLAGSQCVFFFSSGSDSDDKDKEEEQFVVANGNFGAPPVAGANYSSGSIRGLTGSHGEFQYEVDKPVQFSIGDINLGRAVGGKPLITAQDLVADGAVDTPAVINIKRLLYSLDAAQGDEIITIPDDVRSMAVLSNDMLSSSIEFLDFSNDAAFANAASQLVTVLTRNYPFTGVLIDGKTAQKTVMDR